MKKYLVLILTLLGTTSVWAYPSFIGFGYKNCLTCHYNPFGNGPLNDYGRAVSANVISDRLFVPKKISDEKLGDYSGFALGKNPVKFIRPAFDRRTLNITQAAGTDNSQELEILMQNEYTMTFKFGAGDKYMASGTIVDLPAEYNAGTGEAEQYTREAYLGYRFSATTGVYVGKMDKLFGIRISEHNAYSREFIGLDHSSQVHGAVFHYGNETFEVGYQYIMGDRNKETAEHTSGHAVIGEYNVHEKIRVGASFLTEANSEKEQSATLLAVFAKFQAGKGSSIMYEMGSCTSDYLPGCSDGATPDEQITGSYSFLQSSVHLRRGLFFLTTLQTQTVNSANPVQEFKLGPGIQWFPIQRLEFRMDLETKRLYTDDQTTGQSPESWQLLGQMHLWL